MARITKEPPYEQIEELKDFSSQFNQLDLIANNQEDLQGYKEEKVLIKYSKGQPEPDKDPTHWP